MKGKTVLMIGLVAMGHCAAIAIALSFSGCGLTREPAGRPPPPIMPPPAHLDTRPEIPRAPGFAVEPAPAMMETELTTAYVVRPGDTLSQIARRFGVTMSDLVRMNTIRDPNTLHVGQKLVLPGDVQSEPTAPAPEISEPARAGQLTYTVKSGDCLSKIAAAYGTTVRAIQAANGLTSDRIRIGRVLTMPGAPSPETGASPAPAEPALADDEPMAPEQTWPPDAEPGGDIPSFDPLQPATELPDLPEPESVRDEMPEVPVSATEASEPRWHTAGSGEDLDTIAEMYPGVRADDIMRINGMKSAAVVPGQRLRIPWTGE